jgi:serine protease
VEPNFIHKAFSVPNDPLYINQKWHYEQINMPEAWDRSTGAGTVKVAVIDTGVMMNHPDLQSQLTTDGYDFISSSSNSGDGDGPDSDPSDPGDGRDNFRCPGSPEQISSFHGTHVAGTVGASGNDSKGVTGVNWNVDIMPIRVLGCYGGSSFDIIDGILYAAGLPNSRNVFPDSPADIINLSLGSSSPNIFSQRAVDLAREAGVIVVAAAGNDALRGNPINYPAAYAGVVSVGATNPDGNRADYSTYNDDVDVAAPGGFGTEATATDSGRVGSTFATINPDGSISSAYKYESGTSMAAPHVAGVASLMKGIYPALTPNDFDAALILGVSTIDYGTPGKDSHFGYGLIDADKALQTAEALSSGIDADFPPLLLLSNSRSNLGATGTQVAIQAINAGGGSLTISQVSKSADNISVLAPETDDGLGDYVITIDRNGLTEGVYRGSVEFSSDAGIRTLLIAYEELPSGASEPNAGKLYTLLYNVETEEVEKQVSSVISSGEYTFSISDITAGVYALITGSDIDNDLTICGPGEVCAVWPTLEDPDYILANQVLAGLTLEARYQSSIQGSASSLDVSSSSKLKTIPSDRCSNTGAINISGNLTIDSCFKRVIKKNTYVQ